MGVTVGLEPTSATSMVVTPHCGDHSLSVEKATDEISATGGRRRLSPVDVNDVLYRLSHATLFRTFQPTPYEMFGSFIRLFAYPLCEQFARQLGTASHERKHGLMF